MERIDKILGKVASRRTPQAINAANETFVIHWRKLHPYLAEFDIKEFWRMRISCPRCWAKDDDCDVCGGSGAVCPTCRGAGLLARHRYQTSSKLLPCYDCGLHMSEGWVFDMDRLRTSIERYLDDWVNGRAIDEGLTRRKADEVLRKEAEANRPPRDKEEWKHG